MALICCPVTVLLRGLIKSLDCIDQAELSPIRSNCEIGHMRDDKPVLTGFPVPLITQISRKVEQQKMRDLIFITIAADIKVFRAVQQLSVVELTQVAEVGGRYLHIIRLKNEKYVLNRAKQKLQTNVFIQQLDQSLLSA